MYLCSKDYESDMGKCNFKINYFFHPFQLYIVKASREKDGWIGLIYGKIEERGSTSN